MNSYCLSSGEALLFLFFYSYSVAPFLQLAEEVGGRGDVVCEDDAGFLAFCEWRFLLAAVQGEGAQVVSHFLCAADGDVLNGIILIVMPYSEAVMEKGIDVNLGIGDECFCQDRKVQGPIQGKDLN